MEPLTILIGDRDLSDRLLEGSFVHNGRSAELTFNCPLPHLALLEAPVQVYSGAEVVYHGRVKLIELNEDMTGWRVLALPERLDTDHQREASLERRRESSAKAQQ